MYDIIDFHQHLVLPLDEHIKIMDRNGIKKAIVMPFDLGGMKFEEIIKEIYSDNKSETYCENILDRLPLINENMFEKVRYNERLVFIPWISPMVEKTFDILKNNQISIIKLIPLFDNTTKSYKAKLIDCVSKLKQKVVMIHTGWGNKSWGSGLQSDIFPDLLHQFPDKTFICAHMKEDTDLDNYRRLELLNKYSNFFVETSYTPHAKRIWQYVKKGFGDRLLFGSDFRTLEDEQSLRGFIKVIQESDISDNEKKNIFYNNALKLLGLAERI